MNGNTKTKHSNAVKNVDDHDKTNPFCAVHPDLAGRRNATQAVDAESISLGPAQELQRREHANSRTLLRVKKHK